MSLLRFLVRSALLAAHLVTGLIIAGILFGQKPEQFRRHPHVIRLWLAFGARILGVRIKHQKQATDISQCLIISNHISWLDILVLGGLYRTRFLAKSEIADVPLLGWLCRITGTMFIKRGNGANGASDLISQALKQGDNVLIFPEGTTSAGFSVKPFHPRLLKAAIENASDILPVMLSYELNQQPHPTIGWTNQPVIESIWAVFSARNTLVHVAELAVLKANSTDERKQLAKQLHSDIRTRLENFY